MRPHLLEEGELGGTWVLETRVDGWRLALRSSRVATNGGGSGCSSRPTTRLVWSNGAAAAAARRPGTTTAHYKTPVGGPSGSRPRPASIVFGVVLRAGESLRSRPRQRRRGALTRGRGRHHARAGRRPWTSAAPRTGAADGTSRSALLAPERMLRPAARTTSSSQRLDSSDRQVGQWVHHRAANTATSDDRRAQAIATPEKMP